MLFIQYFGPMKTLLLGFLAAAAVAAMLRPLARRIPGPRGLSAAIVGLGFLVVVAGLLTLTSWALVAPIKTQLANWPKVQANLDSMLAYWSGQLGLSQPVSVSSIGGQVYDFVAGGGLADVLSRTADITSVAVVVVMFIFIGSLYLLAEPSGRLVEPVQKLLSPRNRSAFRGAVSDLESRLRWWLLGTLIGMSVVGVASWAGYTLIGLQFALPLGLLAGLTEAIPTIGPAITFLVSLAVATAQGGGQIIGVIGVYVVVQTLESYLLVPIVMRSAVNIPPIVTLFTIVLWGKIFGVAGVLLAIPIDLVIWTMIDRFYIQAKRAPPDRSG